MKYQNVSNLIGVTLKEISKEDRIIRFMGVDGRQWEMSHDQQCCEDVHIEDICGDLNDLIGSPILKAEEATSENNPEGTVVPKYQDSFTWTFYHFATIKGYVTIRWYGKSNGYYSETVDFRILN